MARKTSSGSIRASMGSVCFGAESSFKVLISISWLIFREEEGRPDEVVDKLSQDADFQYRILEGESTAGRFRS